MPFRARRVVRKAPVKLVSSTRSQASSSICGDNPSARTPALFTSTSTGPNRSSRALKICSGAAGSDTSPRTATALPPASSIPAITFAAPPSSVRKFTPTGQPSCASARAIAAPIPREAPVTSAQPSGGIAPPFDQRAAPREARAEGAEQDAIAGMQAARLLHLGERDRDRGGRGVAVVLDAVHHALGRQPEPVAHRVQDAAVGLVVDEQIDVVELHARARECLERDLGHPLDGVHEGLVALHGE